MSSVCVAEIVEPPHYIHRHKCERPAKGERVMRGPGRIVGLYPACGIHLRSKYLPRLWVVSSNTRAIFDEAAATPAGSGGATE